MPRISASNNPKPAGLCRDKTEQAPNNSLRYSPCIRYIRPRRCTSRSNTDGCLTRGVRLEYYRRNGNAAKYARYTRVSDPLSVFDYHICYRIGTARLPGIRFDNCNFDSAPTDAYTTLFAWLAPAPSLSINFKVFSRLSAWRCGRGCFFRARPPPRLSACGSQALFSVCFRRRTPGNPSDTCIRF